MSRFLKVSLLILLFAVLAGIVEFPALRMEVRQTEHPEQTEEAARREVVRPVQDNRPQDREKVAVFWLSQVNPRELAPVETPLNLGTDPTQRARVALEALITEAPTPEQRSVPFGTVLQAFYMLSDGTAVADFSDALSHELPAGISTEQLAVDAIVRTLHAAVPQARRLKILIAGQEAETLAGHVDLTSAFDLSAMTPPAPAPAQGTTSATPAGPPPAAPAAQPSNAPAAKPPVAPAADEKKPAPRPGA